MNYWIGLFRLALTNLRTNRLRSGLTILGMVFGTGAVIATLSSNEGAARYIKSELEKLGTNTLSIASKGSGHFREEDRDLIKKYSDLFEHVYFTAEVPGISARYLSHTSTITMVPTEPGIFPATHLNLSKGRIFDRIENDKQHFVVVLGNDAKKELFGQLNAVGEYINLFIGENIFTFQVIGVLKQKGGESNQADTSIYLPYNTAVEITPARLLSPSLGASLLRDELSAKASQLIQVLLAPRFPDGLRISDAREAIERTKEIWQKQNLVGICLALISLLTGGVGIMNIMLLSVAQRKKEIGLRKAVGAKHTHILLQFLLEAVTVCLLGGILGIIGGVFFGNWVASMMGHWSASISPGTVGLAIGFAMLTGAVFGLLPAMRAAKLDPYEALRS